MVGSKQIQISNQRVKYKFTINRNITIVRGFSGTGKTTLYNLVAEHMRLQDNSGVQLTAPCPCVALTDMDWQNQLRNTSGSIVFIDEGAAYISSTDFAAAIQATDNYYVIFTRQDLHALPYSVDEIYEIKTSGKLHTFRPLFKQKSGRIYGAARSNAGKEAGVILTEDAQAGHQLYAAFYSNTDICCEAASANSAIFSWLKNHPEQKVFVIADGAAFGSEIDRISKLQQQDPQRITLCLPESFEWLILQSGLVNVPGLTNMLEDPGAHIESGQFFSWERFFTDYLTSHTEGTHMAYSKKKCAQFYLVRENMEQIVALIAANMPPRELPNK